MVYHHAPLQPQEGQDSPMVLTCVWLVAVVSLTEVLGILDDRDAPVSRLISNFQQLDQHLSAV